MRHARDGLRDENSRLLASPVWTHGPSSDANGAE
jgi:hypothetical protein